MERRCWQRLPPKICQRQQQPGSDGHWTIEVAAGEVGSFHWSLADSGNWYDFSVTCSAQKTFRRRVAGRIENGKDSVSAPSLGRS
ncbi:DUF756 domain-containing protein [Janthinobacterium lividum]|nr:DUF756 domain-containing protein [Janthinobacterium lividum]